MTCQPNDDGYGESWSALVRATLRDRFQGHRTKANARCGFLTPPAGAGRLIWIKCGSAHEDIRQGFALLEAVRQARLDVRLVLSYEREYPESVDPIVGRHAKTAVGYGPSDVTAVVRRVLERFDPLGIILVGRQQSEQLLCMATRKNVHTLWVDPGKDYKAPIERVVVAKANHAEAWRAMMEPSSCTVADLLTTVVQAQVEPQFAAVVRGAENNRLWWIHGIEPADAEGAIRYWLQSPVAADGVLCLSDSCFSPLAVDGRQFPETRCMSRWQREALPAGTVLVVDEARWVPALAASCDGIHLEAVKRADFWQLLALGQPGSCSARLFPDLLSITPELELAQYGHINEVVNSWASVKTLSVEQRHQADTRRRLFWNYRRAALAGADELLQWVYSW